MTPEVHFVRLHRPIDAERAGLDAFARSFGHRTPETFPIDLAFVGDRLVGYFLVQEQAVIYPALHPERLSPRETWAVFRHACKTYIPRYGDPYVRMEADYPDDGPTVEKMERLGMKAIHSTFYHFPHGMPTP